MNETNRKMLREQLYKEIKGRAAALLSPNMPCDGWVDRVNDREWDGPEVDEEIQSVWREFEEWIDSRKSMAAG